MGERSIARDLGRKAGGDASAAVLRAVALTDNPTDAVRVAVMSAAAVLGTVSGVLASRFGEITQREGMFITAELVLLAEQLAAAPDYGQALVTAWGVGLQRARDAEEPGHG